MDVCYVKNRQTHEYCYFSALVAVILGLCLLCTMNAVAAEDSEYPGRLLFPDVKYISTETLGAHVNESIVVDVRSSYEYDILHIKDAINIPLASRSFVARIQDLQENDSRRIVMYCNGKTCMKSYEAVRKCNDNNIHGVISYDSGIMEWARSFPKQSLLLGTVLKDARRLISNEEFRAHTISPDAFATRMADRDDIVLDIRDAYQREGLSIFVGREHRVLLDEKKRFDNYIKKAKQTGKALLIFDAAGKQVRWLHYYLTYKGLKKFYFMEGGIRAYYKEMVSESLFGSS